MLEVIEKKSPNPHKSVNRFASEWGSITNLYVDNAFIGVYQTLMRRMFVNGPYQPLFSKHKQKKRHMFLPSLIYELVAGSLQKTIYRNSKPFLHIYHPIRGTGTVVYDFHPATRFPFFSLFLFLCGKTVKKKTFVNFRCQQLGNVKCNISQRKYVRNFPNLNSFGFRCDVSECNPRFLTDVNHASFPQLDFYSYIHVPQSNPEIKYPPPNDASLNYTRIPRINFNTLTLFISC